MVETPLIRHGFAVPPSPLWGEGFRVCSNRVELLPLWDVWIHILGIRAECACWGGGPVCRPHGELQSISRNGGRGKPLPYGSLGEFRFGTPARDTSQTGGWA